MNILCVEVNILLSITVEIPCPDILFWLLLGCSHQNFYVTTTHVPCEGLSGTQGSHGAHSSLIMKSEYITFVIASRM